MGRTRPTHLATADLSQEWRSRDDRAPLRAFTVLPGQASGALSSRPSAARAA
jgi:hypothetical protein